MANNEQNLDSQSNEDITERPARLRTLTYKGQGLYETSLQELLTRSEQAWDVVQGHLESCKNCLDDLVSLRRAEKELNHSFDHYRSLTAHYVAFLTKTGTQESSDELQNIIPITEKYSGIVDCMSDLDIRVQMAMENMSVRSKTSMHSSKTKSDISSILVRKQVKVQAARAEAEYAIREADLRKRHALLNEQQEMAAAHTTREKAELNADLELLQHKKNVAVAEAEVMAVQSAAGGSIKSHLKPRVPVPTEDPRSRTEEYVNSILQSQDSLHTNPYVNKIKQPSAVIPSGPVQIAAVNRHSYQQNKALSTLSDSRIGVPPSQPEQSALNPHAPAYYPESKPTFYDPNPQISQASMSNDFIRFLLKKELLLTRLTHFNDKPESYIIWKSGFLHIMAELQANPTEELDLIIKWLGPESSKQATNIRAANARNPPKALDRVWERINERYGSPEMIESALKLKLSEFPKLTNKDSKKLYELCDVLSEIESMKEDEMYKASLSYFDTSAGVIPIVSKLPYGLQEKWIGQASKYKRRNGVLFPPFSYFVEFVRELAKTKNDPSFSLEATTETVKRKPFNAQRGPTVYTRKTEISSMSTEDNDSNNPDVRCPIHKTRHSLNQCRVFKLKPIDERKTLLKELGICFRCCSSTKHMFQGCKETIRCSECGSSKHATALHITNYVPNKGGSYSPTKTSGDETTQTKDIRLQPTVSSKCTQICGDNFEGKSCGRTILVNVHPELEPHNVRQMYAILDDQSNTTLARSDFFEMFDTRAQTIEYTLSSCSGLVQTTGRKTGNFVIEALDGSSSVKIPSIIECNEIPNIRQEIPTPEVALNHTHLRDIAGFIPPLNNDAQILLLIGRDVVEAHHVLDHRIGPRNSPYGQKLRLGWTIIGETCLGKTHKPKVINVNKTYLLSNGRPSILMPCPNNFDVKQTLNTDSTTMLSLTQHHEGSLGSTIFNTTKDDHKVGMSIDDRKFLKIMDKGFSKVEGGNWTAPLPFKDPRPRLSNNREQAVKRAKTLHNSLQKNPLKKEHFVNFMQGVLDKNHAEVAPPLQQDEECWYLPLFGVYHPKKPDQIRGVFDSSAQFNGLSLNNVLLSGPDLTNSLLGILIRFRREPIAITGDIQSMFHCFYVTPNHRNFLRFLWYEDNDPIRDLIEYRMRVHVFGNTASPAVATYGIRKSAEQGEIEFGTQVKDFIHNDFYVDDALTSLASADDAIDLMTKTQQALLAHGNLRLHKIASNSMRVMEAFPPEDRASTLKDLHLGTDELPLQRSLGLCWDLQSDTFRFQVNMEDKPYTKRGLLSTINSLFDPLGFVSPVLIQGRILLRSLMSEPMDWDEPLPSQHQNEWEDWRNSLKLLENLQIPRAYLNISLKEATNKEVHIFSDASEKAIATVAYIKTIDNAGVTHTGFLLGKTKVAPTHGHTIPRLELCVAVLAVEIAEVICDHLELPLNTVRYYTDSRIVLGYIYNETRRFYVYVCNRVARIRKSTEPHQWQYVHTDRNPADQATRSIPSSHLESSTWLTGPSKLIQDGIESTYALADPKDDVELRPQVVSLKTSLENPTGLGTHRFERFSSWVKLVKALVTLKQKIYTLRDTSKTVATINQPSSVDLFKQTEQMVIREVQAESYFEEIAAIKEGKPLPRNSPLLALCPVLDKAGILRVGGRLNHSTLPPGEQNPYIIPGRHHIAVLLVRHYHQKVQHQGRHFTEGAVRAAGLWIVGGKRLICSVLHKCVICRKLRGKQECQKMADLPPDRLTPGPPFTSVGVDAFGPWSVVTRRTRGGQAHNKRWAILFTCLTTRAIHLEVVEEMSTSSFINALRRFTSIRGKVAEFRSDRGTNFIGCTEKSRTNSIDVEGDHITEFLYEKGTKWIFNPPHSSHMGGVWERMIGITRRILDSILLQSNCKDLTHEVLTTLLAEVSAIVNARPLVPVSSDPECPTILSPATLLTQKTEHATDFAENLNLKDVYQAQWKHVQVLANNFWKRWRNEYLQTLQPRRKWTTDQQNVKIGDFVLLKDKNTHRNDWSTGIISRVFPSVDSMVRKAEVRVIKDGKAVTYLRPVTDLVMLLSE